MFSSFQAGIYKAESEWKLRLATSAVRLQWDPDHDPYGGKLDRKAIQIGMKGEVLRWFGTEMIRRIVDVTDFVQAQKRHVDDRELDLLEIPRETVYEVRRAEVQMAIGL